MIPMNKSIEADSGAMDALTAVLRMALADPKQEESCLQVLELLRRLQPDALNVLRADAMLALRHMDHGAAARALTAALDVGFSHALSRDDALSMRAMLAVCLCAQQDAAGLHHAQAVVDEDSDGPAARFARVLLDAAAAAGTSG